jgi:hypothetical protein
LHGCLNDRKDDDCERWDDDEEDYSRTIGIELCDDLDEQVETDYTKSRCQKFVSDRHHHRHPKADPSNARKAFNGRQT